MKKIKHLPLNWPNGLKLTGQHFIETHLHLVEALQHVRADEINRFNYGIGMPLLPSQLSIDFEITGSSIENTIITLKQCNAITYSGQSIVFDADLYGSYTPKVQLSDYSIEHLENGVYIVVSVNNEKRVPIGNPDPNVVPLHHRYVLPEVNLNIVPTSLTNEQYLNNDFLIIAKGKVDGRYFSIDKDYIPPTQRVWYDERLRTSLQILSNQLNSLGDSVAQIFGRNIDDKRRSKLTDSVFQLCAALQDFISVNKFEIENILIERPPIFYVKSVSELALRIFNAFRCMPTTDYEYMLQYFYEWTEISPSELESAIGDILSLKYDHLNISHSVSVIQTFMKDIEAIIKKMSELEYIGLIRENIIISDDTHIEQKKSKKIWNLLD